MYVTSCAGEQVLCRCINVRSCVECVFVNSDSMDNVYQSLALWSVGICYILIEFSAYFVCAGEQWQHEVDSVHQSLATVVGVYCSFLYELVQLYHHAVVAYIHGSQFGCGEAGHDVYGSTLYHELYRWRWLVVVLVLSLQYSPSF